MSMFSQPRLCPLNRLNRCIKGAPSRFSSKCPQLDQDRNDWPKESLNAPSRMSVRGIVLSLIRESKPTSRCETRKCYPVKSSRPTIPTPVSNSAEFHTNSMTRTSENRPQYFDELNVNLLKAFDCSETALDYDPPVPRIIKRKIVSRQRPLVSKTNYHTIRLVENEDVLRSYDLLIQYLRNPHRAQTVQELVFIEDDAEGWYPYAGEGEENEHVELREDSLTVEKEVELIGQFVRSIGLETAIIETLQDALSSNIMFFGSNRRSLHGQRARYFKAAATMFLALCPNIHTFRFRFYPEYERLYECALETFLIRNNHGLLPNVYLRNLRHIEFLHDHDSGFLSYQQGFLFAWLRLFHRLPNIEKVSLSGITTDPDLFTITPQSSNFTKFDFTHVEMSSPYYKELIESSDCLKDLRISTGGKEAMDGTLEVKPEVVGKALLRHTQTLKSLDLDLDAAIISGEEDSLFVDDKDDLEFANDEYVKLDRETSTKQMPILDEMKYGRTIGSLQQFTALKRLAIGIKMLCGEENSRPYRLFEALPTELEELTIRGYKKGRNEWHDAELKEILERKDDLFPRLRVIRGLDEEIPTSTFPETEEEMDEWGEFWHSVTEDYKWVEDTTDKI